jgi:fatty acid desaturase
MSKQLTAVAPEGTKPDLDAFERELTELGESLRRDISRADFRHLRRVERAGRLCGLFGLATAWIAPNPLSVVLLAQGMIARFFIGHHIGHGGYDAVPGIPERYTRKRFARGWRRFVDWLDWWNHDDWLYTHNQLHHPNTQAPLDGDIMDSTFLVHYPKWVRFLYLIFSTTTWKFSYYAPRMRRERALKCEGLPREGRYEMQPSDLLNFADPVVRTLWARDYAPYVAARFVLPALLVAPLGAWTAGSMLANLILAELLHNTQTFVCIRPSHCAADIPLFSSHFQNRREFYVQSVLGTVNYRAGGDVNDFLHGWTNYQIEHHLWPTVTLLQYQKGHSRLVEICRRNNIPYREGNVFTRYAKTARLFMGLEHQSAIDTRRLL